MNRDERLQKLTKGIEDTHKSQEACPFTWDLLVQESNPDVGQYLIIHKSRRSLQFKAWTSPHGPNGMKIRVTDWPSPITEERRAVIEPNGKPQVASLGDMAHSVIEQLIYQIITKRQKVRVAS